MDLIRFFLYWFMALITAANGCGGISLSEKAENFRVTAYINVADVRNVEESDPRFSYITDAILMTPSGFNTSGEVYLADNFDTYYSNLLKLIGDNPVNIYINLSGPGYTKDNGSWEANMDEQSERHNLAFLSGVLEENIKNVLDEYGFDGVFFDYEHIVSPQHWVIFNDFIVSLDKCLGDEYKIGMALGAGFANQSEEAIAATDMVEVMAYDIWDYRGYHAPMSITKSQMRIMDKKGYKRSQLDVGVPFYARPTNHDAYWYAYKDWYQGLDKNGLVTDESNGLVFSFNTPQDIYEKTQWAISKGYGGIMVWAYGYDIREDNEDSLFNAICRAKKSCLESENILLWPSGN